MPINLTDVSIASSFDQLLHVNDGPEATEKTVYSGTGVATALKLGTQSASVDNIQLDGNTIRTLDVNGNLNLTPNGTGSVAIGKAAITGGFITGITDLALADGGTGASTAGEARVNLGLGTMATQAANNVNITGGAISGVAFSGSFSGLTLVQSNALLAIEDIGYSSAAGTGGSVTQLTSRTTGVTLNKPTGEIVLFAASLGGHDAEEFTLTNSFIDADDVVVLSIKSGAAAGTRKYYQVHAVAVAAGSCVISVGNIDNATIPVSGTESPVIQFAIIKGAKA